MKTVTKNNLTTAACITLMLFMLTTPVFAYPPDPAEAIRRFHQALFDAYRERLSGPGHLLDRMKGLWLYLSLRFADGRALLKKIQKCRRPEAYEETLARFFDGRPQWTPWPPADWP